jgi:hypothetical protein
MGAVGAVNEGIMCCQSLQLRHDVLFELIPFSTEKIICGTAALKIEKYGCN